MKPASSTPLDIAVRAYAIPEQADRKRRKANRHTTLPDSVLIIDTETRTDATQALTFGSYRFVKDGKCLEEGLFHADDLAPEELACLRDYVRIHPAEVDPEGERELLLLTRHEFLERFYRAAYKMRCVVVGFNVVFDLSRLAISVHEARKQFAGGFSFVLWDRDDKNGKAVENDFRPRLAIKHIDSKRSLKGFTSAKNTDDVDRIPDGSTTGKPEQGYVTRGHFIDLRTLAFALTDRGFSLETACLEFGVEHKKLEAKQHGIVTPEYIDYNRRDVLATWELYGKLMAEYELHPIELQATKAYSPASVGKGYLRTMGVTPFLERQPDFPKRILGHAMAAFFGGRAEAHIRRIPVPVVYTDFTSMYPTVNTLMGFWRYMIAERIEVVDMAPDDVYAVIGKVSPEWLLDQRSWPELVGFAKVIPDGDLLPVRAQYDPISKDWQIGVNHLYAGQNEEGIWYSFPDLAASALLTGRIPRIVEAFTMQPVSLLSSLKPTRLRGAVEIDPATDDFFKRVIEERKRYSRREDLGETERKRLDLSLKITGNGTAYGILAEMTARELPKTLKRKGAPVTVFGNDRDPFSCSVSTPEEPGEYCFPPIAALITGAARLMLALLERLVADAGGTHAMCDTDSMAIVATEKGGLVRCSGGSHRDKRARECVQALSWAQVGEIVKRFESLNPYDRSAIPGSILKLEDDNFDPTTGKQRQLHCFAISAKRYALYVRNKLGEPELLQAGVNNKTDQWSEHGLGHLLNPTDPNSDDRDWTRQVWNVILREAIGVRVRRPAWFNRAALSRITVSSPAVLDAFTEVNKGKPYAQEIKPFNFLLSGHIAPNGHPIGVDADHFHLIAPYDSDPRKWDRLSWIDRYTGNAWRCATKLPWGTSSAARLKTYADVVDLYAYHTEAKSADTSGRGCSKQSFGLLQRRIVSCSRLRHVGKESNRLEDVETGQVHDLDEVLAEYVNRDRDDWRVIISKMRSTTIRELRRTGLARSTIQAIRSGRRIPSTRSRALISAAVSGARARQLR